LDIITEERGRERKERGRERKEGSIGNIYCVQ